MPKIISISKAKQKLLELSRMNNERGESFIILKDSEPVSVLMSFDEYESIMETLDILEQTPDMPLKLKKAEKKIKEGHFVEWKPTRKKSTKKAA